MMTVIDAATNKPIRDAKIAMGYDYVFKQFQTDVQGKAKLHIDAGHRLRFWARVSENDHVGKPVGWSAANPVDGQPAALMSVDVSLQPGHALGGTVVDVDGQPVAGAGISFQSDNPEVVYESGVLTDKNGHWSANVFPNDSSKITFSVGHGSYASFKSEPLPIDQGLRSEGKVYPAFPAGICINRDRCPDRSAAGRHQKLSDRAADDAATG